jgi:nitrite reductase/ring-hydroxylating ferredoxin subunit
VASHVIGRVADFPVGTQRLVTVGGLDIAVFSTDNGLFALLDRCPHQGGSLCGGTVVGWLNATRAGAYAYDPDWKLVRCPWHGWEYDLKTGQSWTDPEKKRVRPYPVGIQSGASVLAAREGPPGAVPGPYVAETFPVSVDDDYVVLELSRS